MHPRSSDGLPYHAFLAVTSVELRLDQPGYVTFVGWLAAA